MTTPAAEAEQSDLWRGISQVRDRLPAYQKACKYYDGGADEIFASPRMRRALSKTGIHYKINLAKTPVDVITDRLEIAAFTANGGKGKTTQTALDDLLAYNGLDGTGYTEVHRSAGKNGDTYLFVWPSFHDDGQVDIVALDPATTTMVYSRENPNIPLYGARLWQDGERQRAELIYDRGVEKYVTKPGTKGDQATDWARDNGPGDGDGDLDDTGSWFIPNPGNALPLFHMRNRQPWGVPEHYHAYGPQNAINKIVASQISNVDYSVAPQRYALADPQVQDEDDQDDFGLDDTASQPEPDRASHKSNYRAGPGELWYMKGVKAVGQFDPADPATLLDPAAFYIRLMAQVTGIAFHYFDPSGTVPSGESLKVAESPLVKTCETRQTSYESTWSTSLEYALSLMKVKAEVAVTWASSQQVDDLEVQELVALKIANGVPPYFAMAEAGYTTEQLDEWGVSKESKPTEAAPVKPGHNDLNQPMPPAPRLTPKVT